MPANPPSFTQRRWASQDRDQDGYGYQEAVEVKLERANVDAIGRGARDVADHVTHHGSGAWPIGRCTECTHPA